MNGPQDPNQGTPQGGATSAPQAGATAPQPGATPGPAAGSPPPARPPYAYQQPPRPAPIPRDPRRKSPALAALLSLGPGLGQIYVGYYVRGFIHLLVVAGTITLLATGDLGDLTPLFGVFLPFFWLYNIIDAGRRATLYNLALEGGAELDLPGDIGDLGARGSLGGGIILIVAGVVLLAHTRFGVPLDWLERWWPVIPIALGIWLIGKALIDQGRGQD